MKKTFGQRVRETNRRWNEYEEKKKKEYEDFTDNISVFRRKKK